MNQNLTNKPRGTILWFVANAERIALGLLSLWCLLPAGMSLFDMLMYAGGRFPTDEQLAEWGLKIGYINHAAALVPYQRAVAILGGATLLFAVLSAVLCRRRVASRESARAMPWFYLLLGLLLWAVVSAFLSDDPLRAFTGSDYHHDGLSGYFVYAGAFLCASTLREEKNRRRVLRLFCGVVSYLALLMIVQELTRSPFLDHSFTSFRAGVFNQFNHFGYVLCMGIMAFAGLYLYDPEAGRALRRLYLAGFALLLYALLINDTFGAYLASLVALPVAYVFYARSGRKLTPAALLPAALFALISALNALGLLPGASTLGRNLQQFGKDLRNVAEGAEEAARAGTGRFTLWRDTLRRITQRPIFGFGPEGFYGANAITNSDRPHNEYLQIAGYLGIPALALYLAALISLAKRQWQRLGNRGATALAPMILAAAGATVGYLCSACFGNPVFNTAPYYWIFLGLTTADGVSQPLLAPGADDVEAQLGEGTSGKRVAALLAAGALLAAALCAGSAAIAHRDENARERADIQCMRSAEATALLGLRWDTASPGEEYWFDAGSYSLVPASDPMPTPYGLGTRRRGGISAEELSQGYDYDETADYRSRIIRVRIAPDAAESEDIGLSWVEVESGAGS